MLPAAKRARASAPRAVPSPEAVAAASARALEIAARAVDAMEEEAEVRALGERPPLLRLPAEMLVHILRLVADDGHLGQLARPRFVHALNADLKEARLVCWTLAHVVARLLDPRREAPLGTVHVTINNIRPPRQGTASKNTFEYALCVVAGVPGSRDSTAAATVALSAASLRPYLDARISIVGAKVMDSDAFRISAARKRKAGTNDGGVAGGLSATARAILGRLRCVQLHVGIVTSTVMFDVAVETLSSITARPALELGLLQARWLGVQARARLWQLVLSSAPFSDATVFSSEPAMVEARAYVGLARLVVPAHVPPLSADHMAALHATLAIMPESAVAPEARHVYALTEAAVAFSAAFSPPKQLDGEHKRERLSERVKREPALLDGYVAPGRTLAEYVLGTGMTWRKAADLCRLLGVLRTQRGAAALTALLANVNTNIDISAKLGKMRSVLVMAAEVPVLVAKAAIHARLVRHLVAYGAPLTRDFVIECFFVPGMLSQLPAATVLCSAVRMCDRGSNTLFEALHTVQLDVARDIIASAAGQMLCARTAYGRPLSDFTSDFVHDSMLSRGRHLLFDVIVRSNDTFDTHTTSAARCTELEHELDAVLLSTVPQAFFVMPTPVFSAAAVAREPYFVNIFASFRLTPLEFAFLWFVTERRALMRTCAMAAACGVQWRSCRWLLALVLGATEVSLYMVSKLEAATALVAELLERERPDLEAIVYKGRTVYAVAVKHGTAPAVLRLVMPPSMRSAVVHDMSRLAPLTWPAAI